MFSDPPNLRLGTNEELITLTATGGKVEWRGEVYLPHAHPGSPIHTVDYTCRFRATPLLPGLEEMINIAEGLQKASAPEYILSALMFNVADGVTMKFTEELQKIIWYRESFLYTEVLKVV